MSYTSNMYRCPKCKARKPLEGRKRIANAFWCAQCKESRAMSVARKTADKTNATVNGL